MGRGHDIIDEIILRNGDLIIFRLLVSFHFVEFLRLWKSISCEGSGNLAFRFAWNFEDNQTVGVRNTSVHRDFFVWISDSIHTLNRSLTFISLLKTINSFFRCQDSGHLTTHKTASLQVTSRPLEALRGGGSKEIFEIKVDFLALEIFLYGWAI